MSHSNRGRLLINQAGDWRAYKPDLMPGDAALGIVHIGGQTGALVRDSAGQYFRVSGAARGALPQHKVAAALGQVGSLESGLQSDYVIDFVGNTNPDLMPGKSRSKAKAQANFAAQISRPDLAGQALVVRLTFKGRLLASHRFDSPPGSSENWHGRLDQIPWPERGRPVQFPDSQEFKVLLNQDEQAIAIAAGGSVAGGVRRALEFYRMHVFDGQHLADQAPIDQTSPKP